MEQVTIICMFFVDDLQKFCRAVERAVSVPADENCREVERQLEVSTAQDS